MSTAAIAAASVSISVSAAREAREAKCTALVSGYAHETATIEQRQDYEECIDMMHPDALTGPEIMFLKVIIVCAIIGCIVGVWPREHSDLGDMVFGGLVGSLVGAFAPVVLVGIFAALAFLFTA